MTIYWPNDRAHCDRVDCPKATQCIRLLALQDKRDRDVDLSSVWMLTASPDDCKEFRQCTG